MSNVTAVGAALAVAVGFPCPGLAANELLRNGSFEDVCDGKTVGWQIGRHWRFADGCGMNGTRGLAFENLDEKDFYEYPSQGVAFEKGTRYQFSAMVRTEDLNGCVGLCVEWYDAAGKWISGAYKAGLRGTHDWTKFEGATPPIPSEAEKIRFAFFVSKGGFGRVWFDDVSVRPLCRPAFGGLYTSAYRNLQKSGRIRFQAAVNCAEHPRAKAYFTYRDAGCAERRVRATKMTASAASLDLDAAHLAYGTHPVRCELVDGDGVKRNATLTLAVPDGATVYYTLDGSDPRQRGGDLNPTASAYDADAGLVLDRCGSVCVNARARSAKGEWSALESVRLSALSGAMLLFR